jgi:putative Mg2+ transporter-C (MgtC) family protein
MTNAAGTSISLIGYTREPVALTDSQIFLRLLLAAAIGGVLGAERELRHKSAGFRTNILIAMGACVFTIVGMSFPSGDPSRVTAQIVTGIGFLGAGAILHSGGTVHGMTTAAMIWVNAALGAAAGLGHFRLAMMAGALTLAVLLILGPLERSIERNLRSRASDESDAAAGAAVRPAAPASPRRSTPA